uniref:DUF4439 domain-containing protein n=1 Tax=Nocardia farcinica TaxID=37329 RepID=UPI002458A5B0
MQFTSEQHLDSASGRGGVLERRFVLGDIPGILWTPGFGSAPAPLVLVGHPGGLPTMYPRLVARAVHAVANGFAAATIELPGCGERPRSVAADEPRAEMANPYPPGPPAAPRAASSADRAEYAAVYAYGVIAAYASPQRAGLIAEHTAAHRARRVATADALRAAGAD